MNSLRPIFIAIVNYRTPTLVVECLHSLQPMVRELQGGRVIVVDNLSGDDSVPLLRATINERGWYDWVDLLPLPRNGGFSYGNNAAISRARILDPLFHSVLLLNPDTIAYPGVLQELRQFLLEHPLAGIAGVLIENELGIAQCSAHSQPSPLRELEAAAQLALLTRWVYGKQPHWLPRSDPHVCDWVSGACMLVRREVLDSVGPMDEGFFLYYEEVDFCHRARVVGWEVWFVPRARVLHLEGASTGIREAKRRRPSFWFASRRRFFVKVYGRFGLLIADTLWAIGRFSLVLRRALGLGGRTGSEDEPANMAWDLLIGDFKAFWSGELTRITR